MSYLLVLLFIGFAAAQPHQHAAQVSCYPCHGGPGGVGFPKCLDQVERCHRDQVCKFRVSHSGEIRCQPAHDCDREVAATNRVCSTGGAQVNDGCQTCCRDDACVQKMKAALLDHSSTGINPVAIHCPKTCALDNLANCVQKGRVCHGGQYCKVTVDEGTSMMHGECKDTHDLNRCQTEADQGKCDPGHHHCVMGCCQDDKCVAGSLGADTTSLTDFLKGNCTDQLEDGQCALLDQSQHLCGDRLALRVCPKTCGLCSVFSNEACHDTVASGGCNDLVLSEDICKQDVAKHICPETCGLCEHILEEKIKELLAAGGAGGGVQTTAMPPATTADMGVMTCSDLANQDCDYLASVCPTMNCPTECTRCDAPAPTDAATAPPMVTDAPTNVPVVTNAPAVTTGAMVPDTPAVPVDTTAAPAGPVATAPPATVAPVDTGAPAVTSAPGGPIPVATTMAAPVVTAAPASTAAPGVPVVPMATTIGVPVATNAPVVTTAAPVATNAPVATTAAPAVPVVTTAAPAVPVMTNAAPVVTAGPVVTTAAPVPPVVTSAPVAPTGAPVQPIVTSGPTPAPTIVVSAATNVVIDVQTGTQDVKGVTQVTSAPAAATQADPVASVCEDTIRDMSCGDVADVCSSPLLVNYCQKYCGLCP